MKTKVQLYTAQQAYDEIFHYKPKSGRIENLSFTEEGYLIWDDGGVHKELNPNEVAWEFSMQYYEVCMVENENGDDEYAIILYE